MSMADDYDYDIDSDDIDKLRGSKMTDKQFVDGLIIKPPHEKAPDFVKCAISIKRKDLGNWLRDRDEDWINLDVKVAKSGKWYSEVNDWKPTSTPTSKSDASDFDDDIPF